MPNQILKIQSSGQKNERSIQENGDRKGNVNRNAVNIQLETENTDYGKLLLCLPGPTNQGYNCSFVMNSNYILARLPITDS